MNTINTIIVKKTIATLIASFCLAFCLFRTPEPAHLDQAQIFEHPHYQNIVETEHFSFLQENNYVFINQRKRIFEKRFLNGLFSN